MWLVTTIGFFSVVQKPNEDDLTVRARVATDLDQLRERYMPTLSPIISTPANDYQFRARISHDGFATGLAQLGRDIHYGNFKSEVLRHQGYERESLYERVWSVLSGLARRNR